LATTSRPKTFLVLSQVFRPDPAAVGQHMTDAAIELARRGHRVRVLAANRGYEDPTQVYPGKEDMEGVEVRRLPMSSFGKGSFLIRIAAAVSFMGQSILRGLLMRHVDCILVSTSPPMCAAAALAIGTIRRRVRIKYWLMDLNPDQLIALEKIGPTSMPARGLNFINRWILRRSSDVVALDRFMKDRLNAKLDVGEKISVLPPWPPQDYDDPVDHADNPFRKKHNLEGKFVFMYSGNHSIAHPLDAYLEAARRLQDDPRAMFMFIGGGMRKGDVDAMIAEHDLKNVISLPYQPLSELRYSLAAADVHLVSMDERMVGIIHPCKVYGAMAVARPIIMLGPDPSHVSDIIEENQVGWQARVGEGDADEVERIMRNCLDADPDELRAMGRRARDLVCSRLTQQHLCSQFCDVLERSVVE
jgi:colanic acid biosynthesis glycosyl transferase WcaI